MPIRPARLFLASFAVSVAMLATAVTPVAAARKTTTSSAGNDISWPQCGKSFPSGQQFGIVGVNGGLANDQNPCLGPYGHGGTSASELAWSWKSTGTSKLGAYHAVYVNTADPSPAVADWPKSSVAADQYGTCDTITPDSQACAWEYGWERATQDVAWLEAAAGKVSVDPTPSTYTWWLDVETGNSWETGTAGLANNVADLQGMVAAFTSVTATTGIYSTSYQWGVITGKSQASGLAGLADWIPGASTQSGAQSNCSLPSFTGGPVPITQWFGSPFDGDVAC